MIDALHEHQLPVCPLGVGLVLEGSAQLLDGHVSVQDSIVARAADESTTVGITRRAPDQPPSVFIDRRRKEFTLIKDVTTRQEANIKSFLCSYSRLEATDVS